MKTLRTCIQVLNSVNDYFNRPFFTVLSLLFLIFNVSNYLLIMRTLIAAILLFLPAIIISQPCLPQGIVFTTQGQIDSFQVNYPGCTEITGSVTIMGPGGITNLDGLSVLNALNSNLQINSNDSLVSLSGLHNITSIGGVFYILNNDRLIGLGGLESVTSIGGTLYIGENDSLVSLDGLDNLASMGGDLTIRNNPVLADLTALNNITLINGSLTLYNNLSLASLNGLNSVSSIGGSLLVDRNISLVNFDGLGDLNTIGSMFKVQWNSILVDFSGLENLDTIYGDFQVERNYSLVDFSGLNNLHRISGMFLVRLNKALVDFYGLNSLFVIAGYEGMSISDNDNLTSLNGLDSLISITRHLTLSHNPRLLSIGSLSNMTNTLAWIYIDYNDSLTSLAGLDNFTVDYINRLEIHDNNMLSDCATPCFCQYFSDPGGENVIHDNETGCNNSLEILDACETLQTDEPAVSGQRSAVEVYPNPASDRLNIEINRVSSYKNLIAEIYSVDGKLFLRQALIDTITEINIQRLSPGVYVVKVADNAEVSYFKVIKH